MKISTLIDSNVLVDVLGSEGAPFRSWSLNALRRVAGEGQVVFSAIVWAEINGRGISEEQLLRSFRRFAPTREAFPFDAAAAAGHAHARYRLAGGLRERTLPDFLIGAHVALAGHRLLTRDRARYATYFPSIEIISPETHP